MIQISKSGFVRILNHIGDEIRHLDGRGLPLTTKQQLLMALRFYAIGSYQRVAGDLIGVHISTVCSRDVNSDWAIDCTHIPILCPDSNRAQLFYYRKSYYSINCQVICDGNMKIRNIVARWPGSMHDRRIFSNSSIKEKLHQGYCNGYLVGDSSYPCLPYLMTPFLHPQNPAERRYNKAHS
ncbi:putative nuclease HARBI1 [Centruroides vittatus]|uniref:putative nuclease HARBI1 n=1 Tax=Centruroides vittatus TaxID=120091 RepID=UPI00350E9D5C